MKNSMETWQNPAGLQKTSWSTMLMTLILIPVVLISSVEIFWFFFAGGLSPLLGVFAFTLSCLISIRVVGEQLASRLC